jgi:Uma2 family endonuclease
MTGALPQAVITSGMLDASLLLPEHPRPLKRTEYDRLVALGAFEDERVELLHGVLVDMSPNYPGHASPIDRLTMILAPAFSGKAIVRIQLPLVAHDESEPEPDVAVVPLGDYRKEHPGAALLVIEVALSSLNKDRKVKAPLYAASGFREYWIVNVAETVIEVHRAPAEGRYASVTRHSVGEVLRPEAFPDVAVNVANVFD